MNFAFNWIDLLIIAALLFFAFESFGRPLIAEVLDLASFLIAFFLSFAYYNFFSQLFETYFHTPHSLSLVLGFMVLWFLSEVIFYLVIRLFFFPLPQFKLYGEKFLAIIPALLRGVIFIALFLVIIATFPIQPAIKKEVNDSQIGNFILKHAYRMERPVKNVFGGVSQDTLTFLTIKPRTDERVKLGFQTTEFTIDSEAELKMIDMVNNERIKRGLQALAPDITLRQVGRDHSSDMFSRGYFAHYSPENQNVADRANKYNISYLVIGENLAYAPNIEAAHQGLMDSPGHRENILSTEYTRIGIGVMDGGVYGKMFTQIFAN